MFTWFINRTFAADTPQSDIDSATERLVNDQNYFWNCVDCHRRYPAGYMHEGYIDNPKNVEQGSYCMACAQNYGVVY